MAKWCWLRDREVNRDGHPSVLSPQPLKAQEGGNGVPARHGM